LLDWEEVRTMQRSKLVEFGVHTATHRILSELKQEEWEREIVAPKRVLERELSTEAATFCFPNGRPLVDFRPEHLDYLRDAGYVCAFTTESALFDLHGGDPMSIGRVAAGNDSTSETDYFRLSTSGAIQFLKTVRKRLLN
jgi:peptidoglycan/xylan/chitin deacetylase (PgdA/CDA1 family)